jgi:hypothetical protein
VIACRAVPAETPNKVSPVITSWFGHAGGYLLHTAMIYLCALIWFPWLVWRWFLWVEPYVHIPQEGSGWYYPHLAVVHLTLGVAIGYGMARASKAGAVWAWTVPTLVLATKMLLFSPEHSQSVLYEGPIGMTALEYFFGTLPEIPLNVMPFTSWPNVDYMRILAQRMFTAPFYAGIGYTLGALVARYGLLTKMFVFEKSTDNQTVSVSAEASDAEE